MATSDAGGAVGQSSGCTLVECAGADQEAAAEPNKKQINKREYVITICNIYIFTGYNSAIISAAITNWIEF
jgi:hypothetical protein